MKILVPSYHRAETITTPALLAAGGVTCTVVVDTPAEYDAYIRAGKVERGALIVAEGVPPGALHKRQWLLDHLSEPGEWTVHLNDNLTALTAFPEPYHHRQRLTESEANNAHYNQPITPVQFVRYWQDTIEEAERRGAWLAAFALTDNGLFNRLHYSDVGHCCARAWAIHKAHLRFDTEHLRLWDDAGFMADNLLTYGRVLVNRYVCARRKAYAAGGQGSRADREPSYREDAAFLMAKFPGLFHYTKKSRAGGFTELGLSLKTIAQIERWRRGLGMPA